MTCPLALSEGFPAAALSLLSGRFSLAVLVVTLILCVRWLAQPEKNAKCVLALTLPILGLLAIPLPRMLLEPDQRETWKGFLLLIPLAGGIAGIVVGIHGLVEMGRLDNRATRGRGFAIVGMVLALATLVIPVSAATALLDQTQGGDRRVTAQGTRPGISHLNVPLNFRFTPPGPTWVEFDMQKAHQDAAAGYVQHRPPRSLLLGGRKVGIEIDIHAEAIVEVANGRIRSLSPSARIGAARPHTIDGIEGLEWEAEIFKGRHREESIFWIGVHNGFAYHLMYSAPLRGERAPAALIREANAAFAGFAILDRELVVHAEGVEPIERFDSAAFGYRLHFPGTGWVHADPASATFGEEQIDLGELANLAEAVFLRGYREVCAIVPVYLMGREAPPDTVSNALVSMVDRVDPDSDKVERREDQEGAFHVVEFRLTEREGAFATRLRVRTLVGEGYAYLLFTASQSSGPDPSGGEPPSAPRFEFLRPESTPDPAKFTAGERNRHGLFLNALGLHYYEHQQYDEGASWFRAAYYAYPVASCLNNLVDALGYGGRFKDAIVVLEAEAAKFPDAKDLHANHAWVLGNVDRRDEAICKYAELFAGGYRETEHLKGYLGLLEGAGRAADALSALREFAGDQGATWRVCREADLLRGMGKPEEAVRLLESAAAKRPLDAELVHGLIEHYLSADRYREGLETADRLLGSGRGAARTHVLKGRCEFGLEWYKQAKASFEAALATAPEDPASRDWLEHVSNILGEGRNTALKEPIPAVPLPDGFAGAETSEWVKNRPSGSGACYLRWIAAVHFVPEKEFRLTTYVSVRVMDESGVSAFSSFARRFDPWTESIHVNRLDVFDAEGRQVASGKLDDYYVLDQGDDPSPSQDQVAHLPVAGLRPGGRIEFVYTVRRQAPPSRIPFRYFWLCTDRPTDQAAVVFTGATENLAWNAAPGVRRREIRNGILWAVDRPPEWRDEEYRSSERYLPYVAIGDRRASWAEVARDYLEDVADRRPVSAPVKALAERLAAPAKSHDEKVLVLAGHVQRSLAYKAISFGRRARVMNPTPRILENRYGDCKDHALLLVQLLEAAGIPAHLAFVAHDTEVLSDLPSSDQFRHVVAYVPGFRGGRFLDPTDKEADFTLDPPYGLANRDALVLDPENPRLVRLPPYSGDAFRTEVQDDAALRADGTLEVRSVVTAHAYMASLMRYHLKERDESERRTWVQRFLGPGAELQALEIRDLARYERPLVLELRYRVRSAFRSDGDQLAGSLPARWECYHYEAEFVPDRTSPFELVCPYRFETRITLRVPEGRALPEAGDLADHHRGTWLTWEIHAERAEGALILHATSAVRGGRFPAAEYEAFRREAEAARRALAPVLQLTLKPR